MKWLAVGWATITLVAAVSGCTGGNAPGTQPPKTDLEGASTAASVFLEGQDAVISSASFLSKEGTVTQSKSNAGKECLSGRILEVRLIGTFPRIQHAAPGVDDGEVTAVVLTVDAVTGETCRISVGTGPQHPAGGSALFVVDVPGTRFVLH